MIDIDSLTSGIAADIVRGAGVQSQLIETDIVLACERAASRACPRWRLPADRAKWTKPAWDRYLSEALRMEQHFGARLRRIRHDINSIERHATLRADS
jgi:hypothetical protein